MSDRTRTTGASAGIVIYYSVLLNMRHYLLMVREEFSRTATSIPVRHWLGARKTSTSVYEGRVKELFASA